MKLLESDHPPPAMPPPNERYFVLYMWASPENPMKAFLYKTTTDGLKDLPRKVAMVRAKGTLDFAKGVLKISAEARDGVRERNFGFPRRGHFVMKVILGNAHIYIYT